MNPNAATLRSVRANIAHFVIAARVPYAPETLTSALDCILAMYREDPVGTAAWLDSLPQSTFPAVPLTPSTDLKPEKN